jgi:hypothetical protein
VAQRLKSWESPRRQGRNHKGKGGSARQRQLKKQQQMLRKKLKAEAKNKQQQKQEGREINTLPSFFVQSRAISAQVRTSRLPSCPFLTALMQSLASKGF